MFSVVSLRGDVLGEFLFLCLAGCLAGNGVCEWRETQNTWKHKAWHSPALHCTPRKWFGLKPFPRVREQV